MMEALANRPHPTGSHKTFLFIFSKGGKKIAARVCKTCVENVFVGCDWSESEIEKNPRRPKRCPLHSPD